MLEPTEIVEKVSTLFATGVLAGLNVLITAGPTHEAIDPVRFMTNGSSGKMGYALAEAAKEAGAKVTIVSGPVNLPVPLQVEYIAVVSAEEMHHAVMRKIAECDIFLAVAAVSDYRAQTVSAQKIHKHDDSVTLMLERNPDIVADVAQLTAKPFIVGFAAETENVREHAIAKRKRKNMDLIVANRVGGGVGMGSDDNEVIVLGENVEITLPLMSKQQVARQLVGIIGEKQNDTSTIRRRHVDGRSRSS
jgi:phosphopantothenoylcysteine decarboxylase/phosphopantothenate--cysteine ligase